MLLLINILWTGMALTGLGVSLWATWDAIGDLVYIHSNNLNGRRRIQARSNITGELFRLYIHFAAYTLGIIGLVTTDPNAAFNLTIRSGITLWCLVSMEAVLVIKSISARRFRISLIKYDVLHADEFPHERPVKQSDGENTDDDGPEGTVGRRLRDGPTGTPGTGSDREPGRDHLPGLEPDDGRDDHHEDLELGPR